MNSLIHRARAGYSAVELVIVIGLGSGLIAVVTASILLIRLLWNLG